MCVFISFHHKIFNVEHVERKLFVKKISKILSIKKGVGGVHLNNKKFQHNSRGEKKVSKNHEQKWGDAFKSNREYQIVSKICAKL